LATTVNTIAIILSIIMLLPKAQHWVVSPRLEEKLQGSFTRWR